MKTFTVKTPEEYKNALKTIIYEQTTGIIQVERKGYSTETFLHCAFKTPNNNYKIYSNRTYKPLEEIEESNFELKPSGIFTDGHFLDAGYYLYPGSSTEGFEKALQAKSSYKIAEEIAEKVQTYILSMLTQKYPDYGSIPDRNKCLNQKDPDMTNNLAKIIRSEIETEAQKLLLAEKTAEETIFQIKIPEQPYNNPTTAIQYERAKAAGKGHEYIKEKAETHLAKEEYYDTKEDQYLYELSKHYLIKEELRKKQSNIDPESKTFIAIKKRLDEFLNHMPNTKKIKMYLAGKDSMVTPYITKKYPEFSIEGKEIEITCEPSRFLADYSQNNKFNSWNMEIISPKLKEQWNNRNVSYLNDITTSCIERITYGKTVIYKKQ